MEAPRHAPYLSYHLKQRGCANYVPSIRLQLRFRSRCARLQFANLPIRDELAFTKMPFTNYVLIAA
jgi:hypothetical protein